MGRPRTDRREKRTKWVSIRIPSQLYWKIKGIADTVYDGNFTEAAVHILCLYFWFERVIEEMIDKAILKGDKIIIKSRKD